MAQKVLLIERDGPVLQKKRGEEGDSLLDACTFTPGAISAIGTIARQEEYHLGMISCPGELHLSELSDQQILQVQDKVLEVLQGEGAEFDAVLTESAETGGRVFDASIQEKYLNDSYDMSQSLLIGTQRCHALAQALGCRLMWFAPSSKASAMDHMCDELKHLCIGITDDWQEIASLLLGSRSVLSPRKAVINRTTTETSIMAEINIDGTGQADISTGIGFFDHMLNQVARHGKIDLRISVSGDLHVDEHHTIEDTALVLGQAVLNALGDKRGIYRYGFLLPMDECLAQAAVDFSGRPACIWDAQFAREYVGSMPTQMISHFFKSFSDAALCNLALSATGENDHHKAEALFKAFARAVRMAVRRDPLDAELPSTKGVL